MQKGNRFKILERDDFKCQYCGREAPEVVLEIDHIIPKSKGGKDEATNLITCCRECNRGKLDRIIKPLKKPGNIELSKKEEFKSYPTFAIRLDDRTWERFKEDRRKYGLTWNRYILQKLKEQEEYEEKN